MKACSWSWNYRCLLPASRQSRALVRDYDRIFRPETYDKVEHGGAGVMTVMRLGLRSPPWEPMINAPEDDVVTGPSQFCKGLSPWRRRQLFHTSANCNVNVVLTIACEDESCPKGLSQWGLLVEQQNDSDEQEQGKMLCQYEVNIYM